MESIIVKVVKTTEDLSLPKYQTDGAAGMDLYANVEEDTVLKAGKVTMIPTGIKIQLPTGYEVQVRSRSGLAAKNSIFVLNSPGTVDCDFTGEVKVILANFGDEDFVVKRGDRIAQMVFSKVEHAEFVEVESLEVTERGEGGFGHTGK